MTGIGPETVPAWRPSEVSKAAITPTVACRAGKAFPRKDLSHFLPFWPIGGPADFLAFFGFFGAIGLISAHFAS